MIKVSIDQHKGFSLFELLAVVSVMLITAMFSAEPIATKMESGQLGKISVSIHNALAQTRGYAVDNNRLVAICGSNDGSSCNNTWTTQWLIFHDKNKNGIRDKKETIYETRQAPEGHYRVVMSSTERESVSFSGMGFSEKLSTFQVCSMHRRLATSRGLIIQKSGTITSARDNDGDGLRETHLAQPFTCEQQVIAFNSKRYRN